MFYSERDAIDIYERKYSIQEIWWMDEEDRLLFAPVRRNRNRIRNIVRNAVEAIELGIPMPPIYVSEQQNGDFLVLESKDTIYSLLQFLKNNIGIENDQNDADRRMSFYEIDHENPRLASMIMRTVVPVQIIEYRSPKYMHMLTGKFIENWTENREYAIRKIIYKDSRIELVESIRNRFFKFQRTEWVRSLNEINIFNTITNQLPPVNYYLTGGNVYAERKIVVFKPIEVYYEEDVPITLLKIEPLNKKYADTLNHRDYLGAILNLGIDRSKIGDIFIGENVAYIYVITGISDYIINNFTKVKHTLISCKIAYDEIENVRPNLKEIKGTIGNIRLDSIISLAFNKSRSSIVSYIEEKKVFVNGKIITSNGYSIKENDIISVRGLGRVIYNRQISVTKKGKNLVSVSIYC